ncbi:MAG TPA: hypothetical protein VE136_17995 [Anaerolineales bacterium]|nr:hypothetical protein [Anaerolineales bacterium]
MSKIHTNTIRPAHVWLRNLALAYVPGPTTPVLNRCVSKLLDQFRRWGHTLQSEPDNDTDVILTTALFEEPLGWREAMLFTARRRFKLEHLPTIVTLVCATPDKFHERLDYFAEVLKKDPVDPEDFEFPGLSPDAYKTLYEQGRRGGPILSMVRLVQTQTMSIRVILIVGEEEPLEAYTFDLVGAHPRTDASDQEAFYEDLFLRIVTAASTDEITNHKVVGDSIPLQVWRSLSTPEAMRKAGFELGKRNFFTEMVRVANLAHVPALDEAVASQYSEGCFATWDPNIHALIATVTGSARPVEKDNLTEDELAVIVDVRADGTGALVRHVEGKRNDSPSSEAVELIAMDEPLPKISLAPEWGISGEVPVTRSKLHGHRGVKSFDPELVEHVSLAEPYYYYPVSCSTEAQANAIRAAFSRSEALNHPQDRRQVVFTVLPGHGVVIVEKWVPGKQPFQVMWEYMDAGILQIDNLVPQGPLTFRRNLEGLMVLESLEN